MGVVRDKARRSGRYRFPPHLIVVGMLITSLLLAACGGDDDADPTPSMGVSASPTTAASTAPVTATEPQPATPAASPMSTQVTTGEIDGGDSLMGKDIEAAESEGGTLIEGWSTDIETLNPVVASESASFALLQLIFEPLIELHPDTLEPVGVLAESWNVSEDGLAWTFALREGISWHDGEPFTAEDVKFTYDLHLNEETGSVYTGDLQVKISSVEVVDATHVRFTLPAPYADFAVDVGVYAIVPAHIWSDVDPATIATDPGSTGEDAGRVVGTGPFVFEEWIPGDHITTSANADYWGGAPHLDEYIYKIVGDQTAGIQQLKTGEIDWLTDIPGDAVGEFEGNEDVALVDYPTPSFTFYGLNLDPAKTTLFQDVEVRQALLYALDRETMVDTIRNGNAEVAIGTMPTLSWAYNPDGIDPELHYEYDPVMAAELLDEAGWIVGDDGIREKDGEQLAFSMLADSSDPETITYVTAMQEFWRDIGVEMTPEPVSFQELVESISMTFDFEAFMIGFSWGATPDQAAMFDCGSYEAGFNVVRYCNEEVDALLDEAREEQNRERRIDLYTEYQNLLLADLPVAILEFPRLVSGVNSRVHNLFPSAINERFNAETWWVEE